MVSNPQPYVTEEQYLTMERAAPFRSEYLRGAMHAMAGSSPEHSRITARIISLLDGQLKEPCVVYTSDLRLYMGATGLYTYADAVILCGKPERKAGTTDVVLNPRVIVEVLSKSTRDYDSGDKFENYKSIPSFMEYLLIEQDKPLVTSFLRLDTGWDWRPHSYEGREGVIELGSVPVSLQIERIYQGILW